MCVATHRSHGVVTQVSITTMGCLGCWEVAELHGDCGKQDGRFLKGSTSLLSHYEDITHNAGCLQSFGYFKRLPKFQVPKKVVIVPK